MSRKRERKSSIKRYPFYSKMVEDYNAGLMRPVTASCFSRKKNKVFHAVSAALLLLSAGYGALFCRLSYVRLWGNFKDLLRSLAYFALMFFPDVEFAPTVNTFPAVDFQTVLPFTWEELRDNLKFAGGALFTKECFVGYMGTVLDVLLFVSRLAVLVLPVFMALSILMDANGKSVRADLFVKSSSLRRFLRMQERMWYPLKKVVQEFLFWQKGYYYLRGLFFIWFCNLNGCTIIAGVLAFYFYFIRDFDLLKIYVQLYRLVLDVMIGFSAAPLVVWIVLGYILFCRIRRKMGLMMLRRYEAENLAFAKSLPVCVMITATVGAGKTTMMTDLSLTLSCDFRNEALRKMYKYDKFFPDFPWIKFEKYILLRMKQRKIFNLATAEVWIRAQRDEFERSPVPLAVFGYDVRKYPMYHDDGICQVYLWDALEIYCKCFLIYTLESSLLVSNYAIREDYAVLNAGNFIQYGTDFFATPSYSGNEGSRFSHILNYDTLRLGKKMIRDGYADSFEWGIIDMTEGGKERGNNLENLTIKKTDDKCNQKNDLFTYRLKMIRHAAEVDNFCFVRVYIDEQRAMSLGANDRDLCELIQIEGVSEPQLSLPFFHFEAALSDAVDHGYNRLYYSNRFYSGSDKLWVYLLKHICTPILHFTDRVYNFFGYKTLTVRCIRPGAEEGEQGERCRYRFLFKKIYSSRFATDTHAHFFRKRALRAEYGLNDYPVYSSVHATDEELHMQRSHFINEMDHLNETNEGEDSSHDAM